MLTGAHTLLYSSDPAMTRRFFQEVLRWPCVSEGETDEPEEWLIFRTGPSELGVHPTGGPTGETWGPEGQHRVALMCDDLEATMEELGGRGARFDGEPRDMGFGTGVDMLVPGAGRILVYEPRHPIALHL
ncbi:MULTISPECIES: VOC family protein [unclassified Actinotalea]|uniref:VOC family protein n=1 Tax=unclassified Actinotalea TaxID=2638618 RepID=UPI0015F43900|nr:MULTISPECIES: VOC family protein [unclassified Actinotalea]